MRYAIKGSNSADVSAVSGQNLVGLMGRNITSGRAFWLRKCWYPPNSTTGRIILFDASIGTSATLALVATAGPTGPHPVMYMLSATQGVTADGRGLGGYMSFPSPGLKFSLGCCIASNVSCVAATIGSCGGEGYEE